MTCRQSRGFIVYGAIAALVVIGIGAGIIRWQQSRYDALNKEYTAFVANVKAKGEAQKEKVKLIELANLAKKEKSDADYKKLLAANASLNKRLRDNAAGSVLPDPGPSAGSLETACFGRPELDAALRRFTEGTAEIVISGQQATDALNNAKRWATQ